MSEPSPADQQILAILAKLQRAIGADLDKLDPGEIDKIREILTYGPTLVSIAKYEQAKGLLWARWRSIILGAAAILAALALIGSTLRKWGAVAWQIIQSAGQ